MTRSRTELTRADHLHSHHSLDTDAATVHFIFQADHGRTIVMPGHAGTCRAAPDHLVGEKRMNVVDGVELGRGGVLPAETKRAHAALHLAKNEARLFSNASRRDIAEPDD